ncbi:UTRA domain-containing protein [Ruegeria pomeroyi]|nr:UTRA domain-containing protein [Ruegeria pomeroyi]
MGEETRVSYQEIKARVLAAIRDNTWPPGAMLPGEVALAEEYGCARATVNRAMRELAEEGIVERKRKAGTRVKLTPVRQARFAIPVVREEIESTGATYRYALVSRSEEAAPNWLCAQLGLSAQDRVLQLVCMHYADERPFQLEQRWINLSTVPQAEHKDFSQTGPNEWLVSEVPFTDIRLSFSACRGNRETAEFLGGNETDAHFTVERVTWLGERPVTYARLLFHSGYRMTTML